MPKIQINYRIDLFIRLMIIFLNNQLNSIGKHILYEQQKTSKYVLKISSQPMGLTCITHNGSTQYIAQYNSQTNRLKTQTPVCEVYKV